MLISPCSASPNKWHNVVLHKASEDFLLQAPLIASTLTAQHLLLQNTHTLVDQEQENSAQMR